MMMLAYRSTAIRHILLLLLWFSAMWFKY